MDSQHAAEPFQTAAESLCHLSLGGRVVVSRPGHKSSGAGSTKHHLCRHSPITSTSPSCYLPHLTRLIKRYLLPGSFSEYSRNLSSNNRKQNIIIIVSKSHEEAELSLIHHNASLRAHVRMLGLPRVSSPSFCMAHLHSCCPHSVSHSLTSGHHLQNLWGPHVMFIFMRWQTFFSVTVVHSHMTWEKLPSPTQTCATLMGSQQERIS